MVERNSIVGYINAYRASSEEEVYKAKTRIAINAMGGLTTTEFFVSVMKFYEQVNSVDDFVSSLTEEGIRYLSLYNPGFTLRLEKMHYQESLKTTNPQYQLGQFLSSHPVELGELLAQDMNEEEFSKFYVHETPLSEIIVDNGFIDSTYDIVQGEDTSDRIVILTTEKKSFQHAGLRATKHDHSDQDEAQLIVDFYAKYGYQDSTTWNDLKGTSTWEEYRYEEKEVSDEARLAYMEFFEEISENINKRITDYLQINSPYEITNPPHSPMMDKNDDSVSYETTFVHGKFKLFANDNNVDSLMRLFPVTPL